MLNVCAVYIVLLTIGHLHRSQIAFNW